MFPEASCTLPEASVSKQNLQNILHSFCLLWYGPLPAAKTNFQCKNMSPTHSLMLPVITGWAAHTVLTWVPTGPTHPESNYPNPTGAHYGPNWGSPCPDKPTKPTHNPDGTHLGMFAGIYRAVKNKMYFLLQFHHYRFDILFYEHIVFYIHLLFLYSQRFQQAQGQQQQDLPGTSQQQQQQQPIHQVQ